MLNWNGFPETKLHKKLLCKNIVQRVSRRMQGGLFLKHSPNDAVITKGGHGAISWHELIAPIQ